jgi:hypothetical protein
MFDEALNPPPRVPLGDAGTALWESIAFVFGLRPDELEILAQACALADTIAQLDALITDAGPDLMIPGNRPGTFVLHPAIGERRMAIALQAQSLARLRLPNPNAKDDGSSANNQPMSRSEAGRTAATARWSGRGSA